MKRNKLWLLLLTSVLISSLVACAPQPLPGDAAPPTPVPPTPTPDLPTVEDLGTQTIASLDGSFLEDEVTVSGTITFALPGSESLYLEITDGTASIAVGVDTEVLQDLPEKGEELVPMTEIVATGILKKYDQYLVAVVEPNHIKVIGTAEFEADPELVEYLSGDWWLKPNFFVLSDIPDAIAEGASVVLEYNLGRWHQIRDIHLPSRYRVG